LPRHTKLPKLDKLAKLAVKYLSNSQRTRECQKFDTHTTFAKLILRLQHRQWFERQFSSVVKGKLRRREDDGKRRHQEAV
jgi:hypothetical protein